MNGFFGKYRGTVLNDEDPQRRGRIQVSVPAVLAEDPASWALPCVPYGGAGVGFLMIPPQGANVWVEFEGGDPDFPIWVGCFWNRDEELPAVPGASPGDPKVKLLKTDAGTLTLNEGEKSIIIQTSDKRTIILDPQKILIDNGQQATIEFTGKKILMNGNALEVA